MGDGVEEDPPASADLGQLSERAGGQVESREKSQDREDMRGRAKGT